MSDHRDDIERYLRGDMTPAEMHALEKKALQDPFLADALEGASQVSPAEFTSDINTLSERISRRTKTTGPVRWYYHAAAAVLLTGVAAAMILYLSNREEARTSIALNAPSQTEATEKAPARTDTASAQQSGADEEGKTQDTDPTAAREERYVTPDVPADSESDKTMVEDEVVEESIARDAPPADQAAPAIAEDTLAAPALAQTLKTEPAAGEIEPSRAAARSRRAYSAEANSHVVRGQVTDAEDGMPLPGVNVVVKGTEIATVTDLNGYYELKAPATAEALVFSFIGLNTVEAAVPEGSEDSLSLDVKLAPDISALSEVVVTGYGTEGESGIEGMKWEPAEPEGGKRAFRRYLETNMRYPRIALENNVEGKVTVQFTIEPTGDLTDFRVIRGLGYGCDEEVIRLIREGPRWKPSKRNDEPVRGKGRVKLKFELPKDKK
jgi:TonB family protein